jgi:replicative DNA helicase
MNPYLDANVNWLKNHREFKDTQILTLRDVLNRIKTPKPEVKNTITNLRSCVARGDEDSKRAIKDNLPAVTVSGTFKEARRIDNVASVTSMLQVDLDKVDIKKKELFKLHECCVSAFISPSGNGVKAIIAVDYTDAKQHRDAVYTVEKFLEENIKVDNDPSVKDITRLMYVSYDEDIFINDNVIPLKLKTKPAPPKPKPYKPKFTDNRRDDIQEILSYIPADVSYEDWIRVGMALKTSGEDRSVWETWSSYGSKYRKGDCSEQRWNGFNNTVGKGTLVHLAKQNGYSPVQFQFINNLSKAEERYKELKQEENLASRTAKDIKMAVTKAGLLSGYYDIDMNLLGLRDGWLTLIKGRRGEGKTTFTRQIPLVYAKNDIKSFLFFGEGSIEEEKSNIVQAITKDNNKEVFLNRTIYNPTKEAEEEFNKEIGDKIHLYGMKDVSSNIFEEVIYLMQQNYENGVRLFMIDNLMKLTLGISGKDLLTMQKLIITNLSVFAMEKQIHILLIVHPNKSGQDTSGATEIENTADALLTYKRIKKPEDDMDIDMTGLPIDRIKTITASVVVEKGRNKSQYKTSYYSFDNDANAIKNLTVDMQPTAYSNMFHFTEFVHKHADDCPDMPDYGKQYSSK